MSGRADRFLDFLRGILIPYIDERYRMSGRGSLNDLGQARQKCPPDLSVVSCRPATLASGATGYENDTLINCGQNALEKGLQWMLINLQKTYESCVGQKWICRRHGTIAPLRIALPTVIVADVHLSGGFGATAASLQSVGSFTLPDFDSSSGLPSTAAACPFVRHLGGSL